MTPISYRIAAAVVLGLLNRLQDLPHTHTHQKSVSPPGKSCFTSDTVHTPDRNSEDRDLNIKLTFYT